MSSTSRPRFSLRQQPSKPLLEIVRALGPEANALETPFFLAGAAARDLLLVDVWGLPVQRATLDIDFAIALPNWAVLEQLKGRLIATGRFRQDRRRQRLLDSADGGRSSTPVDLIPFQGVATERQVIEWPPDGDFVMNVAGFEEALASCVTVELEPGLLLVVAPSCGLALLKLIAWKDRNQRTNKDATDFWTILSSYADAGNEDRLYGPDIDLLESKDFDFVRAGAALLGRDVRRVAGPTVHERLDDILTDADALSRLVTHMAESTYPESFERVESSAREFSDSYSRPTSAA